MLLQQLQNLSSYTQKMIFDTFCLFYKNAADAVQPTQYFKLIDA